MSKNKKILIIITIFLLCIISYVFYRKDKQFTNESKVNKQLYFVDSKYKDIKSKFHKIDSPLEKVDIEYPITTNESINKITEETINNYYNEYKNSKSQRLENHLDISYQVPYQDDDFLSMIVNTKFDTASAHPVSYTIFWTFNKKSNSILNIKDLVKDNKDLDQLLAKIKSILRQKYSSVVSENILEESITSDTINNFIITSKDEISFPFGKGKVTPESSGEINIDIPITEINDLLQTDQAKNIFNITDKKVVTPQPKIQSSSSKPQVALTFDDGPGAYTNQLLDIFKKYNVKASFFVLGSRVNSYPEIIKREINEGHTVGNHSWSHPQLNQLAKNNIEQQISNTNDAIFKLTSYRSKFLRPPYGATNEIVANVSRNLGMSQILWNVDPRDWADKNSQIVCNRILANTKSGSIILSHDIHKTTVEAMPCVIEGLKKQGYKLVNIETLLANPTPGNIYYHQ